MHRYPLSAADFALSDYPTKGSGKSTAQTGSHFKAYRFGYPHQVGIGAVYSHALRKGSPMGKSRLILIVTDLLVATIATRAGAAGTNKWDRYPIANLPVFYPFAHFANDSCKLMARHMRKLDIGIMTLPAMPVTPANSRGLYFKKNAVFGRFWVRYLGDFWGLPKGFID
jgi:hypothetical protein